MIAGESGKDKLVGGAGKDQVFQGKLPEKA